MYQKFINFASEIVKICDNAKQPSLTLKDLRGICEQHCIRKLEEKIWFRDFLTGIWHMWSIWYYEKILGRLKDESVLGMYMATVKEGK